MEPRCQNLWCLVFFVLTAACERPLPPEEQSQATEAAVPAASAGAAGAAGDELPTGDGESNAFNDHVTSSGHGGEDELLFGADQCGPQERERYDLSLGIAKVPVIAVIAEHLGEQAADEWRVLKDLEVLNDVMNPHAVEFELKNIEYIDDLEFFHVTKTEESAGKPWESLLSGPMRESREEALVIVYTKSITAESQGGFRSLAGYAGSLGIVLADVTDDITGSTIENVILHELGHYAGLSHTHSDREDIVATPDDPGPISLNPEEGCNNAGTCEIACPTLGYYEEELLVSNFMSYHHCQDLKRFEPEQILAIRCRLSHYEHVQWIAVSPCTDGASQPCGECGGARTCNHEGIWGPCEEPHPISYCDGDLLITETCGDFEVIRCPLGCADGECTQEPEPELECNPSQTCCDENSFYHDATELCQSITEVRCRDEHIVEQRIVERLCSGNSTGCNGREVSGAWRYVETCSDGCENGACTPTPEPPSPEPPSPEPPSPEPPSPEPPTINWVTASSLQRGDPAFIQIDIINMPQDVDAEELSTWIPDFRIESTTVDSSTIELTGSWQCNAELGSKSGEILLNSTRLSFSLTTVMGALAVAVEQITPDQVWAGSSAELYVIGCNFGNAPVAWIDGVRTNSVLKLNEDQIRLDVTAVGSPRRSADYCVKRYSGAVGDASFCSTGIEIR